MTDHAAAETPSSNDSTTNSNTAVASRPRTSNPPPKVDQLPPWKVMLHNDPVNEIEYVVTTVMELATMDKRMALLRTIEAHTRGVAMLLTTHRERAELIAEQFTSKRLTVTIERA